MFTNDHYTIRLHSGFKTEAMNSMKGCVMKVLKAAGLNVKLNLSNIECHFVRVYPFSQSELSL